MPAFRSRYQHTERLLRRLDAARAHIRTLEESLHQAEEDRDRAHRIIHALTDEESLRAFRDAWIAEEKRQQELLMRQNSTTLGPILPSKVATAMAKLREHLLAKYPRTHVIS